MTQPAAWSVPANVEDIPEEGRRVELMADEAVRATLARQAGVLGISRLQAAFDLVRGHGDGAHVSGQVSATVRQTCSVSLEPMENEVVEDINITFMPQRGDTAAPSRDLNLMPNEAEEVEPLVGGRIDLGAIATEFLILGIDPYPRKEGAVFAAPSDQADHSSPFEVLAVLKK